MRFGMTSFFSLGSAIGGGGGGGAQTGGGGGFDFFTTAGRLGCDFVCLT